MTKNDLPIINALLYVVCRIKLYSKLCRYPPSQTSRPWSSCFRSQHSNAMRSVAWEYINTCIVETLSQLLFHIFSNKVAILDCYYLLYDRWLSNTAFLFNLFPNLQLGHSTFKRCYWKRTGLLLYCAVVYVSKIKRYVGL